MKLIYQTLTYIIAYVAFGPEEKFLHFLLFFGASIGCLYIMRHLISRQPSAFYLLSIAQVISMFFILSFSIPTTVFLAVVFYIMYGDLKKETRHYLFASLGFTGVSVVINATEQHTLLAILLMLQLFLSAMVTSRTTYERLWKVAAVAVLSVSTFVVVYFSYVIEFLVKGIIGKTSELIVFILNGVVGLFGQAFQIGELEYGKKEGASQTFSVDGETDQKDTIMERALWMDIFAIAVALAVILGVAYFVIKKLKLSKGDPLFAGVSNAVKRKFSSQTEIVQRPPANPVRNKVFHLEKNMKNSYARRKGETFENWMQRLQNMQKLPEGTSDIANTYNRVRYGDETPSKEEITRLNEFYKEIRRRGKDAP